jgi:hypothetical protein
VWSSSIRRNRETCYFAAAVVAKNAAEVSQKTLGGVVLCFLLVRNVQDVIGGLLSLGGGGHYHPLVPTEFFE